MILCFFLDYIANKLLLFLYYLVESENNLVIINFQNLVLFTAINT